MKTLKFLIFAMLALSMSIACSESVAPEEKPELTGTQWKLAALVDMQTRESIEPDPKECNKCYTLEFDSDTTATGQSILNELRFIVTSSNIKMLEMTEIWDGENNNVDLFYDALLTIDTYEYSRDELKIYYDEGRYYLLYYRIFDGMESSFVGTNELNGTGYVFADSVPSELQKEKNIMYIIYNETTHSATFSIDCPEAFYKGDILNFSESTKGWEIPVEGIQINYAGIFYEEGRYLMGYPLVGGYLVLTRLEKCEP
jgi:hypothetical protein